MNVARPDANTYWVEPGRLLAGEYPGVLSESEAREKLHSFVAAGITFFLNLTEEHEPLAPYAALLQREAARLGIDIEHCRLPIRDLRVPHTKADMRTILDTFDQALAGGHRVCVHCWGVIGCTGTVVGCYLVCRSLSRQVALETLSAHWRIGASSPSPPVRHARRRPTSRRPTSSPGTRRLQ